ncbi:MAG: winged helix-turn-helix transcriptional regulator [Lachnospiraceae bacterium]|nr:winged helix-turn-helix transcriptional regulator [Lachnospiraceae bacterium]
MDIERNEKLLSSWLTLSASLWNERFVRTMSFNEAFILNLLVKNSKENPHHPLLSATDLCAETGLLKSQMNRTLNTLEDKGYIARLKNKNDKRIFFVSLTPVGRAAYNKEHEHILDIVDRIASQLGEERTENTAATLNELTAAFKNIERW